LFIGVQHIRLTVIMDKDDGRPVLLSLQSLLEKSSSHRLTFALADAMWVARLMALGARRSTWFQSPSIMN
jgi:hypothetical protein